MITSCGALLSNAYSAEFMARLWPKTIMLAKVNNPRDANCLTYVNFIFNYQCFLFRLCCFHRFHYLLENQFLQSVGLDFPQRPPAPLRHRYVGFLQYWLWCLSFSN